jgi:hypothetical protein
VTTHSENPIFWHIFGRGLPKKIFSPNGQNPLSILLVYLQMSRALYAGQPAEWDAAIVVVEDVANGGASAGF